MMADPLEHVGGLSPLRLNWGISPHPVPLPMGEGTVLRTPSVIQASLLPWGEGQDEGWKLRSLRKQACAVPGRGP